MVGVDSASLYRRIHIYSDTTQLNSTYPVEQRRAKSVVFLFMMSRPTNWVNCCSRCRVEFSWVELCRYKRALSRLAGSWVGDHLAPFYIHQINRVNSRNGTINIVLVIIIIIFYGQQVRSLYYYYYFFWPNLLLLLLLLLLFNTLSMEGSGCFQTNFFHGLSTNNSRMVLYCPRR